MAGRGLRDQARQEKSGDPTLFFVLESEIPKYYVVGTLCKMGSSNSNKGSTRPPPPEDTADDEVEGDVCLRGGGGGGVGRKKVGQRIDGR